MEPLKATSVNSRAEELFVQLFCEAFGPEKTENLQVQYPCVDIYGRHRYIDFALESPESKIAIEIDGETYHNPSKVSENKYADDLLKQNSLVYDNWKVYRWIYSQLEKQPEKVKDELITFLGSSPMFKAFEADLPVQMGQTIELRDYQQEAIENLKKVRDDGKTIALLYHATGVGKTITAATDAKAVGGRTLFLVNALKLASQAKDTFARVWPEATLGEYTGGQKDVSQTVIFATVQSISKDLEKFSPTAFDYLIVDECHHVSASNFEQVLKYANAQYVYGLTATPMRKDGHQPIIFMQCGPIRFTEDAAAQMSKQKFSRWLIPRFTTYRQLSEDKLSYNQILHELTDDKQRNQQIISDVANVLKEGRTPIIISVLVEHVSLLAELIKPLCKHVIILTGSTSAKEKKDIELQLKAVSPAESMVIVASLKYISEGFDLPRLDTLFLAQPVSYKGLVAQYTGRLHRDYEGKTEVRVYDYIDIRQPMCETMYKRRLRGYAVVGYKVRPRQTNPEAPSDMIYDGGSFETAFLADISNARHSIVIACPMIRIYRNPVIIQKLMEQQANGVSIYVNIKREGYDEERYKEVGGTYSVNDTQTIQCAIIDKSICWYGDVNFLGYHAADNTVMRIADAKVAGELLDMMSNK